MPAIPVSINIGAQFLQGIGGRQYIFGLEKAVYLRATRRHCRENERPVGYGFVTWHDRLTANGPRLVGCDGLSHLRQFQLVFLLLKHGFTDNKRSIGRRNSLLQNDLIAALDGSRIGKG